MKSQDRDAILRKSLSGDKHIFKSFIFTIVTLQLKCVEKDSVISFSEKTFLADLINLISLDFASHIEVYLIKDLHNVFYFVLGGPYHC